MARIAKSEHLNIRHLVEVEKRKVAEVAAEYGCTPANIYAILARFRHEGDSDPAPEDTTPPPVQEEHAVDAVADMPAPADHPPESGAPSGLDLFATTGLPDAAVALPAQPTKATTRSRKTRSSGTDAATLLDDTPQVMTEAAATEAAPSPPPAVADPVVASASRAPTLPATPASQRPKLMKAGYGLVMRTDEGEDAVTPFRSLDDLLSAVKPILRTAARNPEPVWFCIQPVDLANIDIESL